MSARSMKNFEPGPIITHPRRPEQTSENACSIASDVEASNGRAEIPRASAAAWDAFIKRPDNGSMAESTSSQLTGCFLEKPQSLIVQNQLP